MITEYSNSKRYRGLMDEATVKQQGRNASCGDEIELELLVKDGKIEKVAFHGSGCAISQASTSMMLELIEGATVEEAKLLASTFRAMVRREPLTQEQQYNLGPSISLKNVSNLPTRAKCATMPWHTLQLALEKEEQA